jgi:hypothetical protein
MRTHKKPCPMFTTPCQRADLKYQDYASPMGCLGDAAAASFMIDHTSCFCPATRLAGLNFSSILDDDEKLRNPQAGANRVGDCLNELSPRYVNRKLARVKGALAFIKEELQYQRMYR